MAIIKCPECGAEISDKAKKCVHCGKVLIKEKASTKVCGECGKEIPEDATECPYCGCPLDKTTLKETSISANQTVNEQSKKKKTKIIIPIVAVIAIVAIVLVVYNVKVVQPKNTYNEAVALLEQGKYDEANELLNEIKGYSDVDTLQEQIKISRVSNEIQKLSDVPTQEEYDRIISEYNSLSDDEKNQITDTSNLEKYADFDLDNLKSIIDGVNSIDESTEFSTVLELKEKYDSLNSEEKSCVDYDNIQSAMELSDIENAALVECGNIRSCMKSKENFKISKIAVKDNTKAKDYYYILVEYSGTNSFGAELDGTSYLALHSTFTDYYFEVCLVKGKINDYLDNNTTNYNLYTDCNETEVIVDVDKIMYYLNE